MTAAFPVAPANHDHLTGAVLTWANYNNIQLRAPSSRQDTYRTVLDLAVQHIDVSSIRWRTFATCVLAEYVEDTVGEQATDGDKKQLGRMVALFGAIRVLGALTVAMTAPIQEDRYRFFEALLRYTGAVLRGWGMTARRET